VPPIAATAPAVATGKFAVKSGVVRVELDRPWVDRGPVDPLLTGEEVGGRWRWSFRADDAPLVLPVLRATAPVLADAIRAATGAVEVDAATLAGDPLRALAVATRPAEVEHPVARAVVDAVVATLQKRIPAGLRPHPYQQVGVAFARAAGYRALIGDEMGLGKTIQAIGALAVDPVRLLPAVIVAPAIVAIHWQRELRAWLPSVPVVYLSRRSDRPPDGFRGIVLTKKDVLAHQARALVAFAPKTIIADEVQYFKSTRARMSRALRMLTRQAPHVLLLSGTPFKNSIDELKTVLGYLGPVAEDTADGLAARMDRVAIRRTKAQVAAWLPPKSHRYLPFALPPSAKAEYRRAEQDFESWLRTEFDRRMAANGENIDADERIRRALAVEALARVGYLRQLTGRAKVSAAVDYLGQAVENGVPVLAFAHHHEVIAGVREGLASQGIRVSVVDGSLTPAQKQAVNDSFESGAVDVVIGSSALLTGASYPRAQEVVFIERYWTPADEMQAESRAHRITSKHPILVSYLHAQGTIDERVKTILATKRKLYEKMLNTGKVEPGEEPIADVLADFLGKRPTPPAPDLPRAAAAKARARRPPITRDDVVAVSFDASAWTQAEAIAWATNSGWRGALEPVAGRFVLRVRRPTRGIKYHAVKIARGVSAIVPRRN
jgi:superfamily II DNA or RNA helicase